MIIRLTELITLQAKTLAVMFCCGILVESLWQAKGILQRRAGRRALWLFEEAVFWAASAAVLSMFLYYCAFGRITLHAGLGFLAGHLLWKKICCGIINAWENNDEAENLRATAKSSTWKKPEGSGWKKGRWKRLRQKKKPDTPPGKKQEGKWLSEEQGTDEG